MKRFMTLHLIFTCFLTGFVGVCANWDQARSFLIGAALMGLSVIVGGFAWKNILAKKLVALSVGVIVIKYAILGTIVFLVITYEWVHAASFVFGVASLMVSSIAYAVPEARSQNNKEALIS